MGGAAALGGALAITGAREANAFVDPIPWTVIDDAFSQWFIFEGDKMLLAPEPEPMRKTGLYAVLHSDGFRLCMISVAETAAGDACDQAFILYRPGGDQGDRRYNRTPPDAPQGHRILSHAPRYWLPGRPGDVS